MYDHHAKAGNQGDVVKHVALVAVLAKMLPCQRQFRYADTFAGYAVNLLIRGGGWTKGIRQIRGHIENQHVQLWRQLWDDRLPLLSSSYPGSSAFVLRMAQLEQYRSAVRLQLWDTSPAVVSQLMVEYSGLEVTINLRAADPVDVESFSPHLHLIDPPGVHSSRNSGYPTLETLFALGGAERDFILWLPRFLNLNTMKEAATSCLWRQHSRERGYSVTAVRWANSGPGCYGCQLVYHLSNDCRDALRAAVEAVVSPTGWTVDHFPPA